MTAFRPRYNLGTLQQRFKAMTPEEKERMESLCKQIQIEEDQEKFDALVQELNEILGKDEQRLIQFSRSTQS